MKKNGVLWNKTLLYILENEELYRKNDMHTYIHNLKIIFRYQNHLVMLINIEDTYFLYMFSFVLLKFEYQFQKNLISK